MYTQKYRHRMAPSKRRNDNDSNNSIEDEQEVHLPQNVDLIHQGELTSNPVYSRIETSSEASP